MLHVAALPASPGHSCGIVGIPQTFVQRVVCSSPTPPPLLIQIRFARQLRCSVDKEQAYIGTPNRRAAKTQLQRYDDENVTLRDALKFSRLAGRGPPVLQQTSLVSDGH